MSKKIPQGTPLVGSGFRQVAGVAAGVHTAVTTTATKTIATEKKSESNIDLQQRLDDREGYHKLKTGGGCFCKTSWAVGASLFEYPNILHFL